MFRKVLIANRGVIACRVARTLRRLGVSSVAVYSEADRNARHVEVADEAVCIGPPQAAQSYLNINAILDAAVATGAEAIHPGYGFLSENPDFAQACEDRGVVFLGPRAVQMRSFGLKHTARELAALTKVPLLPGTGLLGSVEEAQREAAKVGFPVMLKSSAGGGGIGMRLCRDAASLSEAFEAVQRLGQSNFGSSALYLEKAIERARHIEVQIFGDGNGKVIALGERDCSLQRRNQKVMEQTPAEFLPEDVRAAMLKAAVRLTRAVEYRSAGTVEFLYDDDSGKFYFLEVNTRLQVEHGVTEEVTGIDLVEWMVKLGAGELPAIESLEPTPKGCSLQVRIYAEDPWKQFAPSAGRVIEAEFPANARIETCVGAGDEVSPFYDPLLAKVIVRGETRAEAMRLLVDALDHTRISGVETNLRYLQQVCREPEVEAGKATTAFLGKFRYRSAAIDVVQPGTQSTVQDYPGRLGYWDVGVPPSGPMDPLSFRIANRIVGNDASAAGIEVTVSGPTLKFRSNALIAVTGAPFPLTLDGATIPMWTPLEVPAGATLSFGASSGPGLRAYLAIRGGLDVPEYLGSKSTFILGKFGGAAGRILKAGDVLHAGSHAAAEAAPAGHIPEVTKNWSIGVLYGPHGAPDYFTPNDIDVFFATDWKVHHNSDRTGVRLIGPKPEWARKDGGEAGLHPSNIHDNAYAVGAIDFTGDMPVILGPDGPSLGGFVCPAAIVEAERWKMGQLRPGDIVRFVPMRLADAEAMERALDNAVESLTAPLPELPAPHREGPVLMSHPQRAPGLVCRADGDKYLLIEYGPNVLDMNLRYRAHRLEQRLRNAGLRGIIDITAGMRSLQVHYDSRVLTREKLLETIDALDQALTKSGADDEAIQARIVHLPLSWDDPATQLAIERYTRTVRPDAPWCPSNIEFIRRINGLNSVDDVYRMFFDASYLVMGLGDVYLGAPVATPYDPRHRLVTTKYNPARTWTPENAVGIGGAYLCVYGMEGPGGYQFVGRTVQMWNTWRSTKDFEPGHPWLLRHFDQLRFYPVSAEELLELRQDFPHGRFELKTEPAQFSLKQYLSFTESIATETAEFQARREAAFREERERWALAPAVEVETQAAPDLNGTAAIPPGHLPVHAPVSGNVHQVSAQPGQKVAAGDRLLVLEAMKMEVIVTAPRAGIVAQLQCRPGVAVESGDSLLYMREEA